MTGKRRALLSVSDKHRVVAFARALADLDFDLVSTGGTAQALREAGLTVTDVASLTGFPEIMDGRVKTLHPGVHAGLLARPGADDAVLAEHGIEPFDLLAVNLYPFEQVASREDADPADVIENIDVGGPAMIRAAAKNHARLTVVVDPRDYDAVLDAFRDGEPEADLRRRLAAKAFSHTSRYDSAITRYLGGERDGGVPETLPDRLVLGWNKAAALRYGENPHQRAALYVGGRSGAGTIARAQPLQGKPLSYINLLDADAAMQCAAAFDEPACVIVKHATPCGVAVGVGPLEAYRRAHAGDPVSAFGGVIAFNRAIDADCAAAVVEQVADVVIAPEVGADARDVFAKKKNLRLIATGPRGTESEVEIRSIDGGVLVQQRDRGMVARSDLRVVTRRRPSDEQIDDMLFAWKVVKYVKSNAVVYASGGRTLGIGGGQTSRVMSAQIAITKAGEQSLSLHGAAMASDAYFPFRDGIDVAADHGIAAVIQPGGSVRDEEVIRAADERGIAMVFTGMRHFRH